MECSIFSFSTEVQSAGYLLGAGAEGQLVTLREEVSVFLSPSPYFTLVVPFDMQVMHNMDHSTVIIMTLIDSPTFSMAYIHFTFTCTCTVYNVCT